MEVLIKKILKEFVEDKTTFRVVGNFRELIKEDIDPVEFNITKEIIERRLRRINPFVGNFTDKRTAFTLIELLDCRTPNILRVVNTMTQSYQTHHH